ncbi:MAG: chorismate synthase [Victivallales bacterium]|nr:chorismate synthase [Victivallales bacterium]
MSSIFGDKVKVSVFGESHGAAIGVVVDGLPAGEVVDMEAVSRFMERRAPGRNRQSTARKEGDKPEVLSGLLDGHTCGAPLCAIIRNEDKRSQDYAKMANIPRPGHADFTAELRYHGFQNRAGGGHFSGRLTAPLVFAGAVCSQLLSRCGVTVGGHIRSIGRVDDAPFDPVAITPEELRAVTEKSFPVVDDTCGKAMCDEIEAARLEGDSVGGVIECAAVGFPGGIGDPMFDGIENQLAKALFGIPAVKGVEFGAGFAAARMRGSQCNDPFTVKEGRVATTTNNHGGILGGISSGMPIVFRVAIKPTPSIAKPQQSVDLAAMVPAELVVQGRHDPCIVPRAVPVVEAVTDIVLLDLLLNN